ncbi:MAG: hypothetical protein ACKVVP_25450 [Chloroflexota bacterium]
MTLISRRHAALALSVALLSGAASFAIPSASADVAPEPGRTVYTIRCGGPQLSTPGTNCNGFVGAEIRDDPTIFVVGFENNDTLTSKFVYQAAAVFNFAGELPGPNEIVSKATLSYGEYSTVHRSAAGDSAYGILETCNTALGVPTTPWDGTPDKLIQTAPAQTAGRTPATTGDSGTWDVTPQIQAWLNDGKQQGTFVMRGADESTDVKGQAMCISYVGGLSLTFELAPKP